MRSRGFKSALLSTLVIALLVATVISFLSFSSSSAAPEGLVSHYPIHINSNDNFIPANGVVSGSGTENDPYIIEDYIIDASTAHGIYVRNTNAHFIIRNCYVHDGSLGIHFSNVINGEVNHSRMENNSIGISLWRSDNNTLNNNTCGNNERGIFLDESDNNTLSNNTCKNNSSGIYLYYYNDHNTLNNNTCENNHYGIHLYYLCNNNNLTNNIVGNNDYYGVYLEGSDNNRINHNNFVNNEHQAYDDGPNYWDDGYPSGGNYWSDYAGEDIDGDGIGDSPFDIPGDNSQDRYPLMDPVGEVPTDEIPSDERNWSFIAGIVGVAIIAIAVVFCVRKR